MKPDFFYSRTTQEIRIEPHVPMNTIHNSNSFQKLNYIESPAPHITSNQTLLHEWEVFESSGIITDKWIIVENN